MSRPSTRAKATHMPGQFENEDQLSFEVFVKKKLESILKGQESNKAELYEAISFNSARIDTLEINEKETKTCVTELKTTVASLQATTIDLLAKMNKSERFSRRNNVRIVGVEEGPNENCKSYFEKILSDFFKLSSRPTIERAHRDGKRVNGRPRHIIVRFLSYTSKIEVMKQRSIALEGQKIYIIDDLTPVDLLEKKKWKIQVKELYTNGTKLRFIAGKWRTSAGTPFDFSKKT